MKAGLLRRRALLAGALGLVPGAGQTRAEEVGSGLRRIMDRGELRILITPERPPFASRDADGRLVGYDVAVGRMLAQGLGVAPIFVESALAERQAHLAALEGDLACHVPLSTQFARTMLLTSPYLRTDIALASPGRRPVRRPDDLEDRSVGVLLGSGAQQAANEVLPNARRLVLCPDFACLSEALLAGRLDAVVLARASLPDLQRRHPGLALVHRFALATRWITMGLPFGEHDLLRTLNGLLFLARVQGRLSALAEAYLGQPLPDLSAF